MLEWQAAALFHMLRITIVIGNDQRDPSTQIKTADSTHGNVIECHQALYCDSVHGPGYEAHVTGGGRS